METVLPISVAEYHRLIETGVLGEDDRVELINGHVVPKMSLSPGHIFAVTELRDRLRLIADPSWSVRSEASITLSESEPEPGVSVCRTDPPKAIQKRHPGPSECGLVVEVSVSSPEYDRTDKREIYARDGVPVYWIVDVEGRTIEVYEVPNGTCEEPVYKTRRTYAEGEAVPVFLDGGKRGEIRVGDILPEAG